MTNFTPRPALVAAIVIALVTGRAAAQDGNGVTPQLHVTRQGDTLSFALSDEPANGGDFWVLQTSPITGDWDDLMFLDENAEAGGSIAWWEGPSHFFRARRLDADDRVLRAFLEARNTWRNAGIDSYTMEIDQDPNRLVVTSNAVYGFPQFVDVDRALEIADDEEQWTISNFQIKP